jgi:hypothetical protein
MKPPSQVGNGENYPSFDSPDRGVASLILGVGKKQSRADSNVRFDPLSCSPFQAAGANILLLAIERFKSTAVRQGKRHDHENDG